jgi:type II secretory pathway pseudopilin PulG
MRFGPGLRASDALGVTLVELAVSLGLLGLILAGVVTTWSAAQEAFFVGSEAAELQQNVRAAMDLMARELRAAGRDVTACAFDYAGAAGGDCTPAKAARCRTKLGAGYAGCSNVFVIPFAGVRDTGIRFRSDRDDNGTAADTGEEHVTYALARGAPPCPPGVAACITRDDGQGATPMVAVHIQELSFTYYPRPGYPPCDAVPGSAPCPPFALPLRSQSQADNVGRIRISLTARTVVGGQPIIRRLETDVHLRNRG